MKDENALWTKEEVDELTSMFEATNFVLENAGQNFRDSDKFQFSLDQKSEAWMHLISLINVQQEALSVALNKKEVIWQ